ncbi:MAG: hypothetical protein ACM37W_26410 [Actinomycetota bacterium]
MAFFRQYVAPFIALVIFLMALIAVSARIFLPNDLVAPAPVEEINPPNQQAQGSKVAGVASLDPSVSVALLKLS